MNSLLAAIRNGGGRVEDAEGTFAISDLLGKGAGLRATLGEASFGAEQPRLVILGEPGHRVAAAIFEAWLTGAMAVPLTPLMPDAELASLIEESAPAALAATPAELERARSLGKRCGLPVVALAERTVDIHPVVAAPEAGALMLFTSGTTGRPKGAVLSHAQLAEQTRLLREAWGIGAEDVMIHALPLHHLHGLVVALLTTLSAGGTVKLLGAFDTARVLRALEEVEGSVFMGVPTMYRKLVDAIDGEPAGEAAISAGLRQYRLFTSGSAALSPALATRWQQLSGAIPLERYGMTEIGIALSNPLLPDQRRPGRVGHPLASVEAEIRDESGVAGNGPGELWVRGPSVFSEYFRRHDATKASFVDGWFQTGDVAERDPDDGSIRLLGRTSVDILKTGGEKVSALEIEEVLRGHPAVAEVAVVGVPDETWGDRIVAAIVARAGHDEASLETAAVRAWARDKLAPYKLPKAVVVLESLPRNAMGKVQKPAVVQAVRPHLDEPG